MRSYRVFQYDDGRRINMKKKIECKVVEKHTLDFSKEDALTNNYPRTQTDKGYIEGYLDDNCSCFEGIPFAVPPVGDLRFKAPKEPQSWKGILKTQKLSPEPIQSNSLDESYQAKTYSQESARFISEDCLYLNVYSKNNEKSNKAVMVWFYGDSFTKGSANSFRSLSLVKSSDIVLVTFNYRLGILGFFYHENENLVDANCGLLDQIAVLKWVQKNIKYFGGDPNNVTLFGESSGATCITALLSMSSSNSLFHKVIIQSGTCSISLNQKQATTINHQLLKKLGLKKFNLKKMQSIETHPFIQIQEELETVFMEGVQSGFMFAPIVDRKLLIDKPLFLIQKGIAKGISVLIGFNEHEWRSFNKSAVKFEQKWTAFECIKYAKLISGLSWWDTLLSVLKFRRWLGLEGKKASLKEAAGELITTVLFEKPAIKLAIEQCRFADTFLYEFSHKAEDSEHAGACHGLDTFYLFDWGAATNSKIQKNIVKKMQGLMSHFAKYGRPLVFEDVEEWPSLAQNTHQLMQIDTVNKIIPIPHEHLNESLF